MFSHFETVFESMRRSNRVVFFFLLISSVSFDLLNLSIKPLDLTIILVIDCVFFFLQLFYLCCAPVRIGLCIFLFLLSLP